MKRKEAIALIGKPVFCWTALNGAYMGILEEVTDARPFRAVVKTLAVMEYPTHGLCGAVGYLARLPFALYSRHEYGAVNISPYEGNIPDWRESALEALKRKIASVQLTIEAGEKYQSKSYMQAAHLLKRSIITMKEQLEELESNPDCTYIARRQSRPRQAPASLLGTEEADSEVQDKVSAEGVEIMNRVINQVQEIRGSSK